MDEIGNGGGAVQTFHFNIIFARSGGLVPQQIACHPLEHQGGFSRLGTSSSSSRNERWQLDRTPLVVLWQRANRHLNHPQIARKAGKGPSGARVDGGVDLGVFEAFPLSLGRLFADHGYPLGIGSVSFGGRGLGPVPLLRRGFFQSFSFVARDVVGDSGVVVEARLQIDRIEVDK